MAIEPNGETHETDHDRAGVGRLLGRPDAHRRLDLEEEARLARLAQAGNPKARELMIVAHTRLVVALARKHGDRAVPLADVVQEGMVGLVKAVDRYDWRRGYRFSTYAAWWIRDAIRQIEPRSIRRPRYLRDRARKVAAARKLLLERGKAATDAEIAAMLHLTEAQLHLVQVTDTGDAVSLDRGPVPLADIVASSLDVAEAAETRQQRTIVQQAVGHLPVQQRKVLALRYGLDGGNPLSGAEVGQLLGLTRQRIHQIETEAVRSLADNPSLRALTDTPRRRTLGVWLLGLLGLRASEHSLLAGLLSTAGPNVVAGTAAVAVATVAALPGPIQQRPALAVDPPRPPVASIVDAGTTSAHPVRISPRAPQAAEAGSPGQRDVPPEPRVAPSRGARLEHSETLAATAANAPVVASVGWVTDTGPARDQYQAPSPLPLETSAGLTDDAARMGGHKGRQNRPERSEEGPDTKSRSDGPPAEPTPQPAALEHAVGPDGNGAPGQLDPRPPPDVPGNVSDGNGTAQGPGNPPDLGDDAPPGHAGVTPAAHPETQAQELEAAKHEADR
jgi:RNA polymerase primary sigma factor